MLADAIRTLQEELQNINTRRFLTGTYWVGINRLNGTAMVTYQGEVNSYPYDSDEEPDNAGNAELSISVASPEILTSEAMQPLMTQILGSQSMLKSLAKMGRNILPEEYTVHATDELFIQRTNLTPEQLEEEMVAFRTLEGMVHLETKEIYIHNHDINPWT